jgi:hypothetical protein
MKTRDEIAYEMFKVLCANPEDARAGQEQADLAYKRADAFIKRRDRVAQDQSRQADVFYFEVKVEAADRVQLRLIEDEFRALIDRGLVTDPTTSEEGSVLKSVEVNGLADTSRWTHGPYHVRDVS